MTNHLHPTDAAAAHGPTAAPGTPPTAGLAVQAPKELRADLTLAGDPAALRSELHDLLAREGWQLEWHSAGWSGTASKGNKVANVLFGAFAQYHEVAFSFATRPDGYTALTVYRNGDGCLGGLYGMYKVKKSFRKTAETVERNFQNSGALIASTGQ